MNSPSFIKALFITLFATQGGLISPKTISFFPSKVNRKSGFRPCFLPSDFRRSFEVLDSPLALILPIQLEIKNSVYNTISIKTYQKSL